MSIQDDIVSRMRQALQVVEPDLDTTVGTTIRKVLDVVAAVEAEGAVGNYLSSYQYDVDSMTGADLDNFVSSFGMQRWAARRATGIVTFERATPATQAIILKAGTQVATSDTPPVIFQTLVPASIPTGQTQVTVPVQSVLGGSAGNVVASSISSAVSGVDGINSLTNTAATSGGTDPETDDHLRQRFKDTAFRSLAGVEQMFLGIALDNPSVTLANVIGAAKTHREQIQLVGGTATSTIPDAKYVYPDTDVFGPNVDQGGLLSPAVDYTFNPGVLPPTVASDNAVTAPDGIYDLLFDYVPQISRNDPANGITNRIDIYINGSNAVEAIETLAFQTTKPFNNTAGDPLNRTNFQRNNGSNPIAGNYFVRFSFGPVIDAATSGQISIGGIVYDEGVDFFVVNEIDPSGGTAISNSGIEWVSAANGATKPIPGAGSTFVADYTYNSVPGDIATTIRQWRLVSFDVQVHAAKQVLLDLYLAVILTPGYVLANVQSAVQTALTNFIDSIGFNSFVQVSDLLQVVHGVPGVDAVRFLTSTDNATNYAIQQVALDGTTILNTFQTGGRAKDVPIGDDQVPVFNSLTLVQKAENTFGSV